MAVGAVDPVRFKHREVGAFWQAVRAMDDAATRIERACAQVVRGTEDVSAAVVRMRRSLAEVTNTARALGLPPDDADGIDEDSERWMTAIHEAAHAIVGAHLGHRVQFAGAITDTTGVTRTGRDAVGMEEAVIAVAGQVGTRMELGKSGGAGTDYARAEAALAGTGWLLEQAEFLAEGILHDHQGELLALARRIYRHGRENNIK